MSRDDRRIRIALQKSGRLADGSRSLLNRCGLNFAASKDSLFQQCIDFPIDVMLIRDDDIPEYVVDGICELGIVGRNVLEEKLLANDFESDPRVSTLADLGFGRCRLAVAVPKEFDYRGPESLAGMRIATSYPKTTIRFLNGADIRAELVPMSGSVEVAPTLRIADAIADLVSTGSTLASNGLKEVATILNSEGQLIMTKKPVTDFQADVVARFVQRITGVLKADQIKYIMMHAPRTALEKIRAILPGMESPTIIPLDDAKLCAIHAVARETIFWETMEALKNAGASSILVLPIEKIID